MSDHEEVGGNSGYSTPVPELDDHRNQAASVRPDRSRRGTFDSLYGARQMTAGGAYSDQQYLSTRVRDFEEAVEDDDGPEGSPTLRRSRGLTSGSAVEGRAVSPPNSVKAFAEARRRERDLSFSEPKTERKVEDHALHRTTSALSRHSYRSKQHTVADDTASMATNKSAEEDVCFPLQDTPKDDNLHIDFEYLESFIQAENEARQSARRPSASRVFPDLRPETAESEPPPPMITLDGDILPYAVDMGREKTEQTEHTEDEEHDKAAHQVPQPVDQSRVSFFSSAWESTIHAADLEGLILPGEDIRGLFTFPKGETDGVWWLNMNKPSEEEVRAVCRAFGIHPLTIEDITTQESREKIELFPSYYFACFRSFYNEKDEETQETEFVPFNVYVVVFREGALSFSYANNSHATHVRKRITMLKDYVALSSDWICYALM
jgi:magnesium transporter